MPITAAGVAATGLLLSGAGSLAGAFGGGSKEESDGSRLWFMKKEMEQQQEYDSSIIQNKVKDAKAAGLHPLYALGASGNYSSSGSTSRVSDGGSYNKMASGLSDAGQALSSGAINYSNAKQSKALHGLQLEQSAANIENTKMNTALTQAKIDGMSTTSLPTSVLSGTASRSPDEALKTPWGNFSIQGGVSTAQDWDDRYAELASNLYGLGLLGSDTVRNIKPHSSKLTNPIKRSITKNRNMYRNKSDPYSRFKKWMRDNKRHYNDNNYWGP